MGEYVNIQLSNQVAREPSRHHSYLYESDAIEHIKKIASVNDDEAKSMYDAISSYIGGGYTEIRNYQQGIEREFSRMWNEDAIRKYKEHLKAKEEALERFIEKAPKWQGSTTYRGIYMTEDTIGNLQKGAVIDMNGTSSWTTKRDIADAFSGSSSRRKGHAAVVFSVQGGQKHGTSASFVSKNGGEREVTVSKKARYKIKNVTRTGKRPIKVEIELIEI